MFSRNAKKCLSAIALFLLMLPCASCSPSKTNPIPKYGEPLVTTMYTADPSAHVFQGRLYIYPSHDEATGAPADNEGSQYDMKDYHVFSMTDAKTPVVDHGTVLALKDVPWAGRQLWAPDAAEKNGSYYFYFPAKDKNGVFRIGAAVGSSPSGPFTARPEPIRGSFSMDPAVFVDDDGQAYMYFGGLWGGQLERWSSGSYDARGKEPAVGKPALGPRAAKMSADMLEFDGPVKEITILDESGRPLTAGDVTRRFFEGSWVHKYRGRYYLSYSTGNTHYIVYAVGDSPWGPFTYGGRLLEPVMGWTTHHSIVEFQGKWYLFHHDASLSGADNLRSITFTEISYTPDGGIETVQP